ncbi:hypothetical protein GCM10009759_13180 [Kitasatospora saccharophila]|uniref:Uncharacterized protein n=1 Tax=Kitasatospora saccharophila TaxID=407973 RepID=A0ABN2WDJ3_9ACTN
MRVTQVASESPGIAKQSCRARRWRRTAGGGGGMGGAALRGRTVRGPTYPNHLPPGLGGHSRTITFRIRPDTWRSRRRAGRDDGTKYRLTLLRGPVDARLAPSRPDPRSLL